MHELSIAMSILDQAGEEATRRQARLRAVHVRLGPLSGVVPAALASAFELACDGTALAECRLVVEEMPITIYCPSCNGERQLETWLPLRCPTCGTLTDKLLSGNELELTALEIDA